MAIPHSAHEWFVAAQCGALRVVMATTGVALMVVGLALGVSVVMLPIGIVVGLTGVGVLVCGVFGDLAVE